MNKLIDGAMHYGQMEECERGLVSLRQITHMYKGDELDAHLADVAKIEANVKRAKEIQANCDHAGWCWSTSLDLKCGRCGASLWRPSRDLFGKPWPEEEA